MSRQFIVGGALDPRYVNATGARQYALPGIYLNENITASGTLKTVNGLATASIKTMQNLAKASVKTYDGLTP